MGNIIKYYKKLIIQMADEEAPMMEEEEEDELNKRLGDGGFMCCCCLCECTNEKTKDLSCCCFFPIRCGVLFIGIFILCLTLFVFLEIFYQLLNDDIHWWFILVFFTKDDESSRGKLFTACLLVIVGVATEAV